MSEKTELPTPKKIRKSREDGQVAHSKDVTQLVLTLALFGYMVADAENIFRRMNVVDGSPFEIDLDAGSLAPLAWDWAR